ncbi:MAG: hypothetical protein ACFFD4_17390 [Candidatus Odinarchaeota archaeon]
MTWRRSRSEDDERGKKLPLKDRILARAQDTTTPEEISYRMWSWWTLLLLTLIIGTFIILFSFAMAVEKPVFLLLGLMTLIAMPVIIIYSMIMLLPEIKVFGFTVFNPKRFSVRRRFSVGRAIARTMTREFFRQSPEVAFLIFAFVIIYIIAIILAFA